MVIRRVGVASAAKIAGALYAVMGLIGGSIFAAISLASAGLMSSTNSDMPSWLGPMFGVGAIVIFPILYGVMGLIIGALTAVVYNLVAAMAGGLDLEVQ
jgi:hypothetical protein